MKPGCRDFYFVMPIAMIAMVFLSLQTDTQTHAEQIRPCVDDIEKYCKDVKPCEGHIVSCLNEHEAVLSAGCKRKIEEVNKKIDSIRRSCESDIERVCKGVQPGGGRIAKCLREHNREISEVCRERCEIRGEKIEQEKK